MSEDIYIFKFKKNLNDNTKKIDTIKMRNLCVERNHLNMINQFEEEEEEGENLSSIVLPN